MKLINFIKVRLKLFCTLILILSFLALLGHSYAANNAQVIPQSNLLNKLRDPSGALIAKGKLVQFIITDSTTINPPQTDGNPAVGDVLYGSGIYPDPVTPDYHIGDQNDVAPPPLGNGDIYFYFTQMPTDKYVFIRVWDTASFPPNPAIIKYADFGDDLATYPSREAMYIASGYVTTPKQWIVENLTWKPFPKSITVTPGFAYQGDGGDTTLIVTIEGTNTSFESYPTTVTFSNSLISYTMISSSETKIVLSATVKPSPTILTDDLTGTVTINNSNDGTLSTGFDTLSPSITLSPATGVQGNTYNVDINGTGTHFLAGSTTFSFLPGSGITIVGIPTITGPTTANMNITIDKTAPIVAHPLTETRTGLLGSSEIRSANFTVTDLYIISVQNNYGYQGQRMNITIFGHRTNFTKFSMLTGRINLGPGISIESVVTAPVPSDLDNVITAEVVIAADAPLGMRSVTVEISGYPTAEGFNLFEVRAGIVPPSTNVPPNVPDTLGFNGVAYTDSIIFRTTRPILTFNQTDPNATDGILYRIQLSTVETFATGEVFVDYTSPAIGQGEAAFVIGQSGNYLLGGRGQVLVDGIYYWRVKSIDQWGLESDWATTEASKVRKLILDTTPPEITNLSPATILTGYINQSQPDISASLSDNLTGVDVGEIRMMIDGTILIPGSVSTESTTFKFSDPVTVAETIPEHPETETSTTSAQYEAPYNSDVFPHSVKPFSLPAFAEGTNHIVTIEVADRAGNIKQLTMVFAVDLTPPVIGDILVDNVAVLNNDYMSSIPKIATQITDNMMLGTASMNVTGTSKSYAYDYITNTRWDISYQYTSADELTVGNNHSILIIATDAAGNTASKEISPLTVVTDCQLDGPALNFPNPFGPAHGQSTTISYVLTANGNISIWMYNTSHTLIWKRAYPAGTVGGKAGYNEISWNGYNDFGEMVGNGMYIYRIVLNGNKVLGTGRMAVLD